MSRQPRRRRLRSLRRKITARILTVVAPPVMRLLSSTWKVEHVDSENLDRALRSPACIATIWHGRLLVGLSEHGGKSHTVLVSPSYDGSLVTSLLRRFGFATVQGSSNKNPARAVRALIGKLQAGGAIIITPDGPRGPRHTVREGPARIARATGYPILPLGFVCDRSWNLKSWDRFTIPKLGARVALVYGEPIELAPDESDDAVASKTELVRDRMMAAEARGFEWLGREPDW